MIKKKFKLIAQMEEIDILLLGVIIFLGLFIGLMTFLMTIIASIPDTTSFRYAFTQIHLLSLKNSYATVLSIAAFLSLFIIMKELWIMEKRLHVAYRLRHMDVSIEKIKSVNK